MSWGKLEKVLRFNKGLLSAVANGKRRASDALIAKLNEVYGLRMPLNTIPTPPCPIHGVVHPGRCPRVPKSPEALKAMRKLRQERETYRFLLAYNG
jgi:hypothetical protein